MSSAEQLLLAALRSDAIQAQLAALLPTPDLCSLRASSSACCNLVTRRLFKRLHVSWAADTFSRPARLEALARVGQHVQHLTLRLAHSPATFLPPLVHPLTGREMAFLYAPHTGAYSSSSSSSSASSSPPRPRYASPELGDVLTQQYPPLFHAATNVAGFVAALRCLPGLRHLTVRCPGQDPSERYRRGVVDYALISLRIAVERAPLDRLTKLTLSGLHPAAFHYLRPVAGFGCLPSAARRWRQITRLSISVDAWDFHGASPGLDHLKIIDDYIRFFAPSLEKLSFAWLGQRGPCPVALSADPLFAPPRASKKLFHEVTSPMSPLPTPPPRAPMHFARLRHMHVRNAAMNAPQMRALIEAHRATVRGFDFENVVLADDGSWDEALSPVGEDRAWSRSSMAAASDCSVVTCDSGEELPSPSAAAAAASKELLDLDLGGLSFSDEDKDEVLEGLAEDVAAAREASLSFSTKLTKKRVRRRRRKHHSDDATDESHHHHHHHHHKHHDERESSSHSHRRKQPSIESDMLHRPETPVPTSTISAPLLSSNPRPVLLQPTVYDPASPHHQSSPSDGLSPVQRNLEQEEAHRLLAEDPAARASALHRAKEAVLAKLSREFCARRARVGAAEAVSACRLMGGGLRDFGGCGREVVVEDRATLERGSAFVPLMFSRA